MNDKMFKIDFSNYKTYIFGLEVDIIFKYVLYVSVIITLVSIIWLLISWFFERKDSKIWFQQGKFLLYLSIGLIIFLVLFPFFINFFTIMYFAFGLSF